MVASDGAPQWLDREEVRAGKPTGDDISRLVRRGFGLRKFVPPVLPGAANALMMLTANPSADFAQIAELVRSDMGIAGRILELANSPLYMTGDPIASIEQAISRLGATVLGELAAVVSLEIAVFDHPGYHRALMEVRNHCVAVARLAEAVCEELHIQNQWIPIAGLFHDCGIAASLVLIATAYGDDTPPLEEAWDELDRVHAKAGWHVVKAWGVPEPVAEIVKGHHDLSGQGEVKRAQAVICVADMLAAEGASAIRGEAPVVPDTIDLRTFGEACALLELGESALRGLRLDAEDFVASFD